MHIALATIIGLFKRPVLIVRTVRYLLAIGSSFAGLDPMLGAATTGSIVVAMVMQIAYEEKNRTWSARIAGWTMFLCTETLCALTVAHELHQRILMYAATSVPIKGCILVPVFLATVCEVVWRQNDEPVLRERVINANIRFRESVQRTIPFQVLGIGMKSLQLMISTNDYSLEFVLLFANDATVVSRFPCIDGKTERRLELIPGDYVLQVRRNPMTCANSRLRLRGWVESDDENASQPLSLTPA